MVVPRMMHTGTYVQVHRHWHQIEPTYNVDPWQSGGPSGDCNRGRALDACPPCVNCAAPPSSIRTLTLFLATLVSVRLRRRTKRNRNVLPYLVGISSASPIRSGELKLHKTLHPGGHAAETRRARRPRWRTARASPCATCLGSQSRSDVPFSLSPNPTQTPCSSQSSIDLFWSDLLVGVSCG